MKLVGIILASVFFFNLQANATSFIRPEAPVIKSYLTTGYIESLKLTVQMHQTADENWEIKIYKACASYPCSPEDNMTSITAFPWKTEDSRAGDGCLKVSVDEFEVIQCNSMPFPGKKEKAPFTIIYKNVSYDAYLISYIE